MGKERCSPFCLLKYKSLSLEIFSWESDPPIPLDDGLI